MKRKTRLILLFLSLISLSLSAQDQEDYPVGDFSGEWRTFYLHTFNKDDLRDFYAIGTGGHAGYTYSFSPNLKIGGRVYMTFNTNIQDLSEPDETTGRLSRYELGLFDVTEPDNRFFILPGELFITYTTGAHEVTAGRMKQVTPLVNPQDGRMIPTLLEGLWYQYKPSDKLKFQTGVITRIAPRSYDRFRSIGGSIGVYPSGRNLSGDLSAYAGRTHSDFMIITGVQTKLSNAVNLAAWNYFTENVFNTTYIRPAFSLYDNRATLSLEWAHQRRVGNGGNQTDSLRYFQDQYSNLLGAQIGVQVNEKCFISLGYDYITDDGRFLFPREWGREGIFSFQKRERSEGTRKNHALVMTVNRTFKSRHSKLQSVLSVGHQWKPDPADAQRNKYAMPGYTHINLDLMASSEKLPKLVPELLLTYKIGRNDFPENPNFILNKVDMFQINAVINYRF